MICGIKQGVPQPPPHLFYIHVYTCSGDLLNIVGILNKEGKLNF